MRHADRIGLETSVISNGSLLTRNYLCRLAGHLSSLSLSIESNDESIEMAIGRGKGTHVRDVVRAAKLAAEFGIPVKTNSVLTRRNIGEDFGEFLVRIRPIRSKILQLLPIAGENDDAVAKLAITSRQFAEFKGRHEHLAELGFEVVYEDNDAMTGSYVMMLPDGRFFNNTNGRHVYSAGTILDDEPLAGLAEVGWDRGKFVRRGGMGGLVGRRKMTPHPENITPASKGWLGVLYR